MPGSLILLGGDPGVGKSTLLLQTAGALAAQSSIPRGIGMGSSTSTSTSSHDAVRGGQGPVVYVSGEESTTQVASRAARLGIESSELLLVSDNDADRIADTVVGYFERAYYDQGGESRGIYPPCLLVIDSVQTMTCVDGGNTSPGGVSQVRAVANLFLRLSKSLGIPVVMIGHVTKEGAVAGPRTVEHMVSVAMTLLVLVHLICACVLPTSSL
jgi:DNA repair protein RadA/Sms